MAIAPAGLAPNFLRDYAPDRLTAGPGQGSNCGHEAKNTHPLNPARTISLQSPFSVILEGNGPERSAFSGLSKGRRLNWYDAAEGVFTEQERWAQVRLDELEVPEHVPSARRMSNAGGVPNENTGVVTCNCGYVRWFATVDLARAVSKYHELTGEEL